MKKIVVIILIGIFVFSCSKEEVEINGDLYFKLIDAGSFYGADIYTIEYLEKSYDSIREKETADKNELEALRIFDILKENNLLTSPWINVKVGSEIKKIYLSDNEYRNVKNYDLAELINENKKVKVKLNAIELDSGIYYSEKISELKLVKGKTYWQK